MGRARFRIHHPASKPQKEQAKALASNGFLVIVGGLSSDLARQVVKYPPMDCSIGVSQKEAPFAFSLAQGEAFVGALATQGRKFPLETGR
jgi:hypothetical protein